MLKSASIKVWSRVEYTHILYPPVQHVISQYQLDDGSVFHYPCIYTVSVVSFMLVHHIQLGNKVS